ncbi:carboxypeptidase-like regulatory domain-containing protein [Marivirga sp.]|uniref:carboxypeptidase-like regulatory domain-containing protein n=1 Tax=Marivirga sp. TaxID=2018662 RepID=UPI0025DAD68B|nr:carboxypeptidase-like regulatory domain-containing protein [Marivirga sp.]
MLKSQEGKQLSQQISGTLFSEADSTTIPFANIHIKGTTLGTHSNEEGLFSFKFQMRDTDDTVVNSSIGYEDLELLVSNLISQESDYYLIPEKGMLKEVLVKPTNDTLSAIVGRAIKRIPFNYPRRAFLLKGFYREMVVKNKNYVRLLEAAVSVQDNGFDVPYSRLKIRLDELKKSEDYIDYSFYKEIYKLLFGGDENNLYKSFEFDFIRAYNSEDKYRFLVGIYNRFDFELDSVIQSNNELIYVLNFYSPTFHIGGLQTSGKTYINANDFGIVKLEYNHYFIPVEDSDEIRFKNQEDLFLNNIYRQSVVTYRKIGRKYYLSYIKWKKPVKGAWQTETEDGESAVQFYDAAFYVTDVKTRRRDFRRIRNKETIAIDQDLFKVKKPYNEDFWNNFNSVIIDPKLEKAKADIEQLDAN